MLPDQAIAHSVQQHPTPDSVGDSLLWTALWKQKHDILVPWGTRQRDLELRRLWYNVHATLIQGAIAGLVMKVRSTPYEISGGRNLTHHWHDVFFESEFGEGYDTLMDMFLQDFFTLSFGGVFEIIGKGAPDKPLVGRVLGVAHLDSLQCVSTGNPEFPIVYSDPESGKMHRMHKTRVRRIADLVSPQRMAYRRGFSVFERALAVSNAQMLLSRHETELLNDQPPTGLMTISGINQTQWESAKKMYEADREADGSQLFRAMMQLVSIAPGHDVKVDFIPFSQLPEDFDYEKFMRNHVNLLALAIGVDPQDIWPLTGSAMGTGTQSVILAAKGQAKTYGSTLRRLERVFNSLLPESLEWKFKPNDREAAKEDAERAQLWVGVASAAPDLTSEQRLQLLANNVDAFADVLLDGDGQLIRLPDDDTQTEDDPAIAADTTPPDEAPPVEQAQTDDTEARARKDYLETQQAFISNLTDLIEGGLGGDITKRRFVSVMNAQIKRLGQQAYIDGLADGGVEGGDLSDDDRAAIAVLVADAAGYVSDFADRVYSGTSAMTPETRAIAWTNKTLNDFHAAGVLSADANGLYQWRLGSTEEHCKDCLRLNGQKHRLKEWHKKDWLPRASRLACNGFNCDCELVRTSGRAKGRF